MKEYQRLAAFLIGVFGGGACCIVALLWIDRVVPDSSVSASNKPIEFRVVVGTSKGPVDFRVHATHVETEDNFVKFYEEFRNTRGLQAIFSRDSLICVEYSVFNPKGK